MRSVPKQTIYPEPSLPAPVEVRILSCLARNVRTALTAPVVCGYSIVTCPLVSFAMLYLLAILDSAFVLIILYIFASGLRITGVAALPPSRPDSVTNEFNLNIAQAIAMHDVGLVLHGETFLFTSHWSHVFIFMEPKRETYFWIVELRDN